MPLVAGEGAAALGQVGSAPYLGSTVELIPLTGLGWRVLQVS